MAQQIKLATNGPCEWHKAPDMGYMGFFNDSEKRFAKGQRQAQCRKCKHWYWPEQLRERAPVLLKDLEIGDIFVHARQKGPNPTRFTIRSKRSFFTQSGRAFECLITGTGDVANKTRFLKVIKVGESTHKAKFIKLYSR